MKRCGRCGSGRGNGYGETSIDVANGSHGGRLGDCCRECITAVPDVAGCVGQEGERHGEDEDEKVSCRVVSCRSMIWVWR